MNTKSFLLFLLILTFFACKTEEKKARKSTENTEKTTEDTTVEKVTEEVKDMDLSKVQNTDVTEEWKTKPAVVLNDQKDGQEITKQLLAAKKPSLDNGRWISTDDSKAGIEIKDGKIILFYKGTETSSNDIYNYELTEHEGVEYLTLTNASGEELKYSILEYAEEILIISYLARGNTLTYTKEK